MAPELAALSSTFVYKEMFALEEKGYDTIPFSVRKSGNKAASIDDLTKRISVVYNKNLLAFCLAFFQNLFANPTGFLKCIKLLWHDIKQTSGISQKIKLNYQFLAGMWLAKALKKNKVDHLHIHFGDVPTQIGMYAAQYSEMPFSFMVHANDLFQRPLLYPEKSARAAAITTISDFNKDKLIEAGVAAEKIFLVRCGVDPQEFKFLPKQEIDEVVNVCVVARLVHKKGIDVLIRAAHLLKNRGFKLKLEIAGDGPEAEELEQLAARLSIQDIVNFTGRIENKEIPGWFKEQDIFVLPARKDRNGDMDGIPVVLMEAMSQGLPVISTTISGIPELVLNEKTGITVAPENAEELADAIDRLSRNEKLRSTLIQSAKNFVNDEFSIQKNVSRLENVIIGCQQEKEIYE